MSITPDAIEKIARLARIRVEPGAIGALTERLDTILQMADRLQAVDTDGVAPMANPLDATQRLRADTVSEPTGADALRARDAFLAIAPATEQGLYLVPRVIE